MTTSFDDKVEALKKLREKRLARKEQAEENKSQSNTDTAPVGAWTEEPSCKEAKAAKEEREEREAFEGSATGGNADAQYCMGHYAEEKSDFKKAAEWYKQAAEDGHPAAQWRLGHFFEHGLAGETSDVHAAHWYMQASSGGHAEGQFSLAVFLEEGRGMQTDERSALNWHRAAAMQGHKMSMFCLGSMYEEGRGTKRSIKEAKEWYAKALEAGFPPAKDALADLENEPEEESEEVNNPDPRLGTVDIEESSSKGFAERVAELEAVTAGGDLDDDEFNDMMRDYDFGAMPGGGDQLSELAGRVAAALNCVDDSQAIHLLDQLMSDDPQIDVDDDLKTSLDAVLSRSAPAA
eukprot:gnl/MRDRNA2_/MRDRNA2_36530_c0_seq1.p1 gnl/MRDRNA2_/MRDRNA2_36530_c0~~gnl/MRDRNA2_/MRDRNA2_36530_c0_seq1.p1  ORF type:complete len:368 (+),score=120.41 gnl/MRDRNA2_/MRDRNA2_36530_c0_seq1:60-1106(+)